MVEDEEVRWLFALMVSLLTSCFYDYELGVPPEKLVYGPAGDLYAEGAQRAFDVQEIDVHFTAAWSRYRLGDKEGSAAELAEAAGEVQRQGGRTENISAFAQKARGGSSL
ncbi:MAG: hypothetical protein AAGC74_01575, partial [Verrucomicrobiota bacterium]